MPQLKRETRRMRRNRKNLDYDSYCNRLKCKDTQIMCKCFEVMLLNDFTSHCETEHGIDSKTSCVTCFGEKQWDNKPQHVDHLNQCLDDFLSRRTMTLEDLLEFCRTQPDEDDEHLRVDLKSAPANADEYTKEMHNEFAECIQELKDEIQQLEEHMVDCNKFIHVWSLVSRQVKLDSWETSYLKADQIMKSLEAKQDQVVKSHKELFWKKS